MKKTIYLAVTDDDPSFRKVFSLNIQDWQGIELLFEAGNGQELLERLAQTSLQPHVLTLDIMMDVMDGVETARKLRELYPGLRIIILSSYFSKVFVRKMLELGVAAYLPKNVPTYQLEATIRCLIEEEGCQQKGIKQRVRQA